MAKVVQLENKDSSDTAAEKIHSQDVEDEEEYERYIPVEQSIIESLKQVREMRAGRMPERSWREFFRELREEDAAEERSKVNEKRRINA